MKEKIEKAKSWAGEHKEDILMTVGLSVFALSMYGLGWAHGNTNGAWQSTAGWMRTMCKHPDALAKDLPELLIADAKM